LFYGCGALAPQGDGAAAKARGTVPMNVNLLAVDAQALGPFASLLPILLIMVIFYVLLILPAQRRQKKTQQMLAALKAGDKVVTNGGICGTIVGLEDDAVQLRIADQVKVRVLRSAIAGLQPENKE